MCGKLFERTRLLAASIAMRSTFELIGERARLKMVKNKCKKVRRRRSFSYEVIMCRNALNRKMFQHQFDEKLCVCVLQLATNGAVVAATAATAIYVTKTNVPRIQMTCDGAHQDKYLAALLCSVHLAFCAPSLISLTVVGGVLFMAD